MDDLLAPFALDAVDPAERALVEQRLAADPAARAEVDEMRETAAALASLPGDDEGAPEGLWDRIADAIGAPAAGAAEPGDRTAPNVVPLASRTERRRVSGRVLAALAAAAAIVIVVLAVSVATRTTTRSDDLAVAFNHAVAHGATKVSLHSNTGSGAVAAEIALQPDGSGYLRNQNLAALPPGKTYQLWAIVDQGSKQLAISAGVLGRSPDAVAFHVAGAPGAFAITIEHAPGVVASANAPVALGKVAA